VVEPTEDETVLILRGLQERYEEHHGLKYTNEAIDATAQLAARHITGRQLPDKAIDLMDEVGSMARLRGLERVDVGEVEETVALMARIPPKSVSTEDRDRLKNLGDDLRRVIFGQDGAIEMVVTSIKMSRAGIGHILKPVGSFLFAGPTGVGKTELSRQLALTLGVEFHRFDMSEYMEKHSVSRLIGAPPGYVGFDQGGLLTDAVHKTPHCVLVMDEIEKAHQDVFNILLQIMDHATLTDNNGRKTDFRNVIVILTTNAGSREAAKKSMGFVEHKAVGKAEEQLKRLFPPEFRNRLDATVWFNSLPEPVILQIVDKFLLELEQQLGERDVTLAATEAARHHFAKEGFSDEFGAREMARVIQEKVKRTLADEILFGELRQGGRAEIDFVDGKVVIRALGRPKPPPVPEEEAVEEEEPAAEPAPDATVGGNGGGESDGAA
jgi:ATP-dependent Clp protease ATP-binding subunit ClpA